MEPLEKRNQSDLPPVPETSGVHQASEAINSKASETASVAPVHPLFADDQSSQQAKTIAGSATDDDDTDDDASLEIDVPEEADDIDLIEKAWVHKAKEIVDSTMGDPYKQNKQISKMKVEYIKKRYNKDVKLNED